MCRSGCLEVELDLDVEAARAEVELDLTVEVVMVEVDVGEADVADFAVVLALAPLYAVAALEALEALELVAVVQNFDGVGPLVGLVLHVALAVGPGELVRESTNGRGEDDGGGDDPGFESAVHFR